MNTEWLMKRVAVSQESADAAMAQLVPIADAGGFHLYLVGGSVRDRLMGGKVKDLDIVVAHPDLGLQAPKVLAELAKEKLGAHGGALTNQGTIVVRIGDVELDLAAPRAETYDEGSRKPAVEAAGIAEDARRRDFTINALYEDLHNPSPKLEDRIVDPTGQGLADLKNKVLRSPNPEQTFLEDPLRMMRAIRFKNKTGFELDPETEAKLQEALPKFKESLGTQKMSWERARTELEKLLGGTATPGETMRLMTTLGLTTSIIPEWEAMVGAKHDTPHHLEDIDDHSYRVLDEVAKLADGDVGLLLAGLLHDIAKPATKQYVAEKMHSTFHDHHMEGVPLTRAILERLRFPNDIIDRVCRLVENHLKPHQLSGAPNVTDKSIRRFIRDMGEDLKAVIDLSEADIRGRTAETPGTLEKDLGNLGRFRERVEKLQTETPGMPEMKPLLDGNELQSMFDRKPGKWIGDAQKYLLDLQLGDPTMTKEKAAELIRAWLESGTPAEAPAELNQPSQIGPEWENGGIPPQKTASKTGHGVVSAYLAGLTEEQNRARLEQLKAKVSALGYKFEVMDGSWRGVPEKSLLIKSIPEDIMQGLAEEFSQEAFAVEASSSWLFRREGEDSQEGKAPESEPSSPQGSGEASQPQTPPPSSHEPETQGPPVEPSPSVQKPRHPYGNPPPLSPMVTGHPVFVKALASAQPVLDKYAPLLGVNSNDPMSVLDVMDQLHNRGRLGIAGQIRTKLINKEIVSGDAEYQRLMGEYNNTPGDTDEEGRDTTSIARLFTIVGSTSDDSRIEIMDTWQASDASKKAALVIGSSGFGHEAWLGKFYPKATMQRDRFAFYASRFAAVEITSSRHSVPPTRVLINWAAAAPAGFVFAFCAPITVRPSNPVAAEIMKHFLGRIKVVGKKLGPVVLHIGPLERYEDGLAAKFFDSLPAHRYAVHVESAEWQNGEVLLEMLKRNIVAVDVELGRCATDCLGWSYKRIKADRISELPQVLEKDNSSLVFVDDKSDGFPSKDLLQALEDLGFDMPYRALTMPKRMGPSELSTGPGDSSLPSSAYDDERGEPLTVIKPTEKDTDEGYFGKKQDPIFPVTQYPDTDANDGKSDPLTGVVDGDTRNSF